MFGRVKHQDHGRDVRYIVRAGLRLREVRVLAGGVGEEGISLVTLQLAVGEM